MVLTRDEFEKKLNQLLTEELPDDQQSALEDHAAQDAGAARKLDQARVLQAALNRSVRDYRQTTYPGNLAAEVQSRVPAKPLITLRRRRWAYALAATLVIISSLVLWMRNRPTETTVAAFQPSVTVMADIGRELSEFKTAHSRPLADWSRQTILVAPNPGAINITGFKIPARPTMSGQTGIMLPNQEGAKL
jgi:hypothetical protein